MFTAPSSEAAKMERVFSSYQSVSVPETQARGRCSQGNLARLPALEIDRRECLVTRQADVERIALRDQQQGMGLGRQLDAIQNLPIAAGDDRNRAVAGVGDIQPLL